MEKLGKSAIEALAPTSKGPMNCFAGKLMIFPKPIPMKDRVSMLNQSDSEVGCVESTNPLALPKSSPFQKKKAKGMLIITNIIRIKC